MPTYTPSVTLIANAHVSDGNWHSVNLSVSASSVSLSVDSGRVLVSAKQSIMIPSTSLVLGGINGSGGVVKGLDGCLQNLMINDEMVPLSNSSEDKYNLLPVNVSEGCYGGDLCNSTPCLNSTNSTCSNLWKGFKCSCPNKSFLPVDNQCMDLCKIDELCTINRIRRRNCQAFTDGDYLVFFLIICQRVPPCVLLHILLHTHSVYCTVQFCKMIIDLPNCMVTLHHSNTSHKLF